MMEHDAAPQLEGFQPGVVLQKGGGYLDATLPNRWSGRDDPTPWPPSSSDFFMGVC